MKVINNEQPEYVDYLTDTSNHKGYANLVYVPDSVSELENIIGDSIASKTPLTIAGARTGTTAGSVALAGNVCVLDRLNKVIGIDTQSKTLTLEAGSTFKQINEEVASNGLTFRASPTEELAFIAGAIATSASGIRGFGYGSIRKFIESIGVILASGRYVQIRRGCYFANKRNFNVVVSGQVLQFELPAYSTPGIKSQAGYFVRDDMDLIDLFIGSEGTLGVITDCTLKLQNRIDNILDGLIFFTSETEAFNFVDCIRKQEAGIQQPIVIALEYFDNNSLNFLKQKYSFIPGSAVCAVYFEQELGSGQGVSGQIDYWFTTISKYTNLLDESVLAETQKERNLIFEFRHSLPQLINEFLRHHQQVKVASDCAVPWSRFNEMYKFYREIGLQSKMEYVNFGHIGQAHLHFNFLPKSKAEYIRAKEYLLFICKRAVELGGTVSAEHGIGKLKKPHLKLMYTSEQIMQMARVKKYFDPYCILNLDNIFDKELLKII